MIKANVYKKKLEVENFTVADSVKFDKVRFTFPDDWEGYTKTAVFKTENGQTINVILDKTNPLCVNENECYIPHEVLKAPHFYLSVFGVLGESVATTTQKKVEVLQSGYAEGDEPSDPTPTEYQQIINLVDEVKNIAQSVRDDADNGVFDGTDGKDGESANITVDQTYNPESENPQSGIAVAEAIAGIEISSGGNIAVDQIYNSQSTNPQSGVAVAEAITETLGDIETALDSIIAIQETLIGGEE